MSDKVFTLPRPAGVLITTDLDTGEETYEDVFRCIHCQRLWPWRDGSKKIRGWCANCGGHVCGPNCTKTCVHWEQVLENIEAGMPESHRPIRGTSGFEAAPGSRILVPTGSV